jgi:hypothetical protein
MADLAGSLNIELERRHGRVIGNIGSSRPVAASRVFLGKRVEETTVGLPALFSICATAQACACASAFEAALGLSPEPRVTRLRRLLVDAETVKEHLWRMLLDWPGFLGQPPRARGMSAVMGAYAGLRTALRAEGLFRPGAGAVEPDASAAGAALGELARLSADQILGAPPADWLERTRTPADLLAWAGDTDTPAAGLMREVRARGWTSLGRNPTAALPRLRVADLEPLLGGADADRFVALPLWLGRPRETSPFTRQRGQAPVAALTKALGNGLLPRLAAQLLELASLQRGLRAGLGNRDGPDEPPAAPVGGGVGIALVPAARGMLAHRVRLDSGRVADYRILAPTEWNFHPRGVVAQGLSALPDADAEDLALRASLFVTAVDPCVEYHVTVS